MDKFATLEDLKEYLGITDSDDDALLNSLIEQATAFIQSYTWRDLIAKDYTDQEYNWEGQREFILDQFPVNSLTSFQYNTWTLWNPIWSDFDPDTYKLDPKVWKIFLGFNLLRGFQNIRVTFNAGYDPIPADIEFATIKIAAWNYNTRNADWIVSESVDGASIRFGENKKVSEEVLLILDPYKNV